MNSIVSLLLLAGVGIVALFVVVTFIVHGKKKDLHDDPARQQRTDAYVKDAPGDER